MASTDIHACTCLSPTIYSMRHAVARVQRLTLARLCLQQPICSSSTSSGCSTDYRHWTNPMNQQVILVTGATLQTLAQTLIRSGRWVWHDVCLVLQIIAPHSVYIGLQLSADIFLLQDSDIALLCPGLYPASPAALASISISQLGVIIRTRRCKQTQRSSISRRLGLHR